MDTLVIHPSSKGLYRLTLAEIIYYMPDYKDILQSFVWQNYDYVPDFPNLKKFLAFWEKEIEGRIHSLKISSQSELQHMEFYYANYREFLN